METVDKVNFYVPFAKQQMQVYSPTDGYYEKIPSFKDIPSDIALPDYYFVPAARMGYFSEVYKPFYSADYPIPYSPLAAVSLSDNVTPPDSGKAPCSNLAVALMSTLNVNAKPFISYRLKWATGSYQEFVPGQKLQNKYYHEKAYQEPAAEASICPTCLRPM